MDFIILVNFTLLATFGCQAAGKLIMKPRDMEVKVNHSTYFNCSTDYGSTAIFWFHGNNYIYTGNVILEPYHERFAIDRNMWNGTYVYNLVIHSVQSGDAGRYICAEDEGVGEQYSIQLIVLDDDPICRSNVELDEVIGQNTCNIEPDKVELECSVKYHGNIPPQMEWKKVGENSSTPLEVSVVNSRNHFVSTLKLKGDIALNNSSYVCETKRTTQEPIKCISKVIKIFYSDGMVTEKSINVGDSLACIANSTFPCIYFWYSGNDTLYPFACNQHLRPHLSGEYLCRAKFTIRRTEYTFDVMKALVAKPPTPPESIRTITITISVVTVVVVGVLIFVLLCIVRKRVKAAEERFQLGLEKFETDRLCLNELLKRDIFGLAVLDQEVFISRQRCPDIEVYDSTTLHFKRRMEVDGMTNHENIVSCSIKNCLYAFDWEYKERFCAMLKIDPTDGNLIKTWNVNGRGGRLSVAKDTNVILNINYEAKLHEYTADGELIRIIDLEVGTDIFRAWHAVKLPSGLFVIVQGCEDGAPNRVCLLSTKASTSTPKRADEVDILKVVGREEESTNRLIGPVYLSVNKEGSILVSDQKTVLLSSNLDKPQIIVSEEDGLEKSWRTCFDESTGQWFVADYHRVMVCRVQDKEVERRLYTLTSH